jgi:hypothetical protein
VGWLVNTLFSALIGLVVGGLIVLVLSLTLHRRKGGHGDASSHTGDPSHTGDASHAGEASPAGGAAHTSGAHRAPRPGDEPAR